MDHPAKLTAVLGQDRNHVAFIPDGDDRLRQVLGRLTAGVALQFVADFALGLGDQLTQPVQFAGGFVGHPAVGIDRHQESLGDVGNRD